MADLTSRTLSKLKQPKQEIRVPIGSDIFIPNLSGDHSKGIVNTTPVNANSIVNKAYVDGGAGDKFLLNTGDTSIGDYDFAGQIKGKNGTAASPSFAFTSDINTGIYWSSDPQMVFVVNGAAKFIITASSVYSLPNVWSAWDSTLVFRSFAANGATAIGHKIQCGTTLSTAGAKIVSYYANDGLTEKASIDINGAYSSVTNTTALGSGVTTFAAAGNNMIITGDVGTNTIATITNGRTGQRLLLLFVDALVTITDDNTHAANSIDLSAAFTSADDTILELFFDGTSWYEIGPTFN